MNSEAPSPLTDLLARVEAAEGPDTLRLMGGLDDRIWRWVNDNKFNPLAPGWQYDLLEAPHYTASLDAALALCERVLPEASHKSLVISPAGPYARLAAYGDGGRATLLVNATADTAPLALLAAMLKALIAQAESHQP